MKKQTVPRILPGLSVKERAGTVKVSPAAFQAWPWNGKAWPCKGEIDESITFHFCGEGADLEDAEGLPPDEGREGAFLALSNDCGALVRLCLNSGGREIAIALLNPDSEHGRRILQTAREVCQAYGQKLGKGAGEWAAMDTWGGRVGCPRKARESAAAFLKGWNDGDPAIMNCLPYYGEGATLNATALAIQYGFDGFSTEINDIRRALEALDLQEAFSELAEDLEEAARLAFDESLGDTLCASARSTLEGEESK